MALQNKQIDPGWHPSRDDLAGADLISDWQVFDRASGPYLIHGVVAGRPLLARLRAMDAVVGWALIADRLLVLGERSVAVSIAVLPREVMQRATEPPDERSVICAETAALAERARRAGMPIFAYLLDIAAIEAANTRRPKRGVPEG